MFSQESKEQNRGKIVLAVDDSPEDILFLRTVVSAAGYSFLAAGSGHECLQMVNRTGPRLILLDIEMPKLNGLDTCRRLRSMREISHIPIAFLTARNTKLDVQQGLAAGGNDFIVKPFDHVQLLDRVRHWTTRQAPPPPPRKPPPK